MSTAPLGGSLRLTDDLTLSRMGYGTMQLAGPGVWGPPHDPVEAVAALREAVERGITHMDTSDYYGPHIVNELIREALHPYPPQLQIVTKVGARRAPDKSWPVALSREELDERRARQPRTSPARQPRRSGTCASAGWTVPLPARSRNRSPSSRSCSSKA
jgi:aryl-alcohol dehydrogenase-like predicted oxidoreductase